MTQHHPSRRALALSTSAVLLAGSGVALLPWALAASPACTTYTDVADDGTPNSQATGPALSDANDTDLDLLSVTHATTGGALVSTLQLAGLQEFGPAIAFQDDFAARFTVGGKAVVATLSRDFTDPTSDGATSTTVTVAGVALTAGVTGKADVTASTVTVSIALAELEKAVGAPVMGQPLSALSALSRAVYQAVATPYDTATAPTGTTYVVGAACGAAGPAPSGPPSATPSGSPSASPSTSPSAAPSATASPTSTVAPTSPNPAGGAVLSDTARAGCADILDDGGDATPQVLLGEGPGNDTDADITQVNYRASATTLAAHVRLASVGAGGGEPFFNGVRIDAGFTVAGKALLLSATEAGPGTGSVGGTESADLPVTAVFDEATSTVVLSTTRAAIAKVTGKPLKDGDVLTATRAATAATSELGTFEADTAQAPEAKDQVHTVGDLACFYPPAPKLEVESDPGAQFGDTTSIFVSLRDESDQPLVGKVVSAVVGSGKAARGTTDEDGLAEVVVPVSTKAGAQQLVATYAGDAEVGPGRAAKAFTVAVEKTVLKATAGKGGVAATLTDDDRRAVAGQVVVFSYGKTKTSVRTDAKGVARVSVARGTTVTASYPGSSGTYAAAKAVSAKAT